jgi:hypothetical protein
MSPTEMLKNGSDREMGHRSFCKASLLSNPAVTQQTRVQSLSPKNKCIPVKEGYRNRGVVCPIHSHMLFHWLL